MKLFAVLLGALALVAGFTGGLRAYSASEHHGPPIPTAQVSVRHHPPAQVVRPGPVVKWAPCVKPAVRVGRACVTHVIHTVALPAPAATTTAPTTTSTSPTVRAPRPSQSPTRHPTSAPTNGGGGQHDDGGDGGGD